MAGKSETFIKLGLVFFISLLSFAIGTLVGSEYKERQYKLSKLEPGHGDAHATREVASEKGHGATTAAGAHGSKLSDEEIAKLAEEFVTDETVETAKAENHKEVPAIENKATAAHSAQFDEMNDIALAAAQDLIENRNTPMVDRKVAAADTKAKTAEKKPALPQTLPKNSAQENVGKYTVQVGSYKKEEEAKTRSEALRAKGYTAFYIPGTVDGTTFYRVNVGTYATIDEAKKAHDKYSADNGGQKGFVKEIVK